MHRPWRAWVLPVLASLILLAISWPTARLELHLGPATALPVGLATCLPVILVVAAPVQAWLLSLLGALVLMVTVHPPPTHPLALPAAHAVVLLVLVGVVAVRARGRMVVVAAVVTEATAVVADVLHGVVQLSILTALALVAVLTVALLARAVVSSRRALAEREELTERERAQRTLLEERARIARELHDVVAHSMSMVVVRAETARYRLPGLGDDATGELAAIADAARRSLAEVRGVLGVLRADSGQGTPPTAPQPGLDDVDALLDETARAGVVLHVTTTGDPTGTAPTTAVCLYRILAEALANASRHAADAPVEVSVDHGREAVRVRVVNGPGRDATGPGAGLGLPGMRERAAVLGGELDAGPAPDGGFVVSAVLPTTGAGVPA